jgi:sec-independent protein translocase protein TatC
VPTIKPIGHDDRLSLVEHLDELRNRIFICLAGFAVALAFCAWQNDAVLNIVNEPVQQTAFKKDNTKSEDSLERSAQAFAKLKETADAAAVSLGRLAGRAGDDPAAAAELRSLARAFEELAEVTPSELKRKPITLKVGEPFTATLRVVLYAALLLSLPLLLYQMFAFILPAFSPTEQKVALPLMIAVPFLFLSGVVFGYFMVLPKALDFLQNFNDDEFDILLQAQDLYKFSITVLIAMGLVFQIPVVVLGITRVGIISVAQLRAGRRYSIVAIAVLAMLLPGTDPVTMIAIMIPLLILYEGSILLAALLDRRSAAREAEEAEAAPPQDS